MMNLTEIASASALIKEELAPLAEKLGEGVEYTFELFVRQAYVNAFIGLLIIPFGFLGLFVARKLYMWAPSVRKGNSYGSDDNANILLVLSLLVTIFSMVVILLPFGDIIKVLVNPEYQAIQLIVTTFKTQIN